ncbi:hypothetical protein ACHAXT_006760 [Thalassiosira profunda]
MGADEPSLPKLLASLALGARAVNALPLSRENNDAQEEDGDDEFSFQMSLPEFSSLNTEARQSLSSLLSQALEGISTDEDAAMDGVEDYEFDDPELWTKCADACDALYDRVSAHIAREERRQDGDEGYDTLAAALGTASQRARTKASGAYGRMLEGLADMEKPQNVFQGFVTQPPQNSREEPFVPTIVYDAAKQAKLDGGEFTKEGHGLDTRFDGGGGEGEGDITRRKYAPDMVAPSHHCEHPYREEIEALEYRPWQLDVAGIEKAEGPIKVERDKNDNGIWIGKEEELAQLALRITDGQQSGEIHEIAIDLEAHSHRTFAGFVCLIQLSVRHPISLSADTTDKDFLIDALALRHAIPAHLGPILANPNILKVMHGADSDIPWLQRDFGCYVVNLFDTGRASRALKFTSAGLAYLLRKYAGIEADKVHQLSDWRRRPLPEDMRGYAVSDTRYLLDIYDQLRLELEQHSMADISIKAVLDRSKQVCLIRYDKEPFRPSGYQTIMDGGRSRRRGGNKSNKVTSELSSQQEEALKVLYNWRDQTARQEDESVQYVCSNSALLRIASNRPATVAALQRLVNPLPPLVMRRSQEILNAIKMTEKPKAADTGAKVAASKSAVPPQKSRNREMLSPILGSEALYQQAGWMTPTIPGVGGSSGVSESEEEEGVRKFLDVNAANQGYKSTQYSSHSLEMSPPSLENEDAKGNRGASADGLATARTALGNDAGASIEEDAEVAQRSASLIKKEMMKTGEGRAADKKFGNGFSLMDLIRPMSQSEGIDYDNSQETADDSGGNGVSAEATPEEDELVIPKSMKEIYSLSNANRRKPGKEKGAPKALEFPESDVPMNAEKLKEDDLEKAEAIIASRGPGGYFAGGNKRQKASPGKEGKESDIQLMLELGWVKDRKDAESLAVVRNDAHSPDEKEKQGGAPHHKKGNAPGARGGGGGGTVDYHNMGAGMGAFDPNAAPPKNPFFAGAATSAASMLHSQPRGKPQKKKVRGKKKY